MTQSIKKQMEAMVEKVSTSTNLAELARASRLSVRTLNRIKEGRGMAIKTYEKLQDGLQYLKWHKVKK